MVLTTKSAYEKQKEKTGKVKSVIHQLRNNNQKEIIMAGKFTSVIGNWRTEGTQDGWSYPASGAWKGTLALKSNQDSQMVFTDGNVAPSRSGNWVLGNNRISIVDTQGTQWVGTVNSTCTQISGTYDSGPAGAAGGSWSARRV